ncbi:hypothetical protein LG284_05450 [Citricoccus nitrophenolicus]
MDVLTQVGLVWDWFGQNDGQLALLATVATAIVAMGALLHAKQDSIERSRPVVVASLELAPENDTAIQLVVRNYGQTPARDVRIRFDRNLEAVERPGDGARRITERYSTPIGTLGPGQVLRNSWWTGVAAPGERQLVNLHGTPDSACVTVQYADLAEPSRFWRRSRRYADTFPIDVRDLMLEQGSVSSTSLRGRLGQLVTAADAQAKAMTALVNDAKEISRQIKHARQYGRTVIITDQVVDAGHNFQHFSHTEPAPHPSDDEHARE